MQDGVLSQGQISGMSKKTVVTQPWESIGVSHMYLALEMS